MLCTFRMGVECRLPFYIFLNCLNKRLDRLFHFETVSWCISSSPARDSTASSLRGNSDVSPVSFMSDDSRRRRSECFSHMTHLQLHSTPPPEPETGRWSPCRKPRIGRVAHYPDDHDVDKSVRHPLYFRGGLWQTASVSFLSIRALYCVLHNTVLISFRL